MYIYLPVFCTLFEKKSNNFTGIFIRHFSGEVINEKDKCKKCHGKKTIKENKILEVNDAGLICKM